MNNSSYYRNGNDQSKFCKFSYVDYIFIASSLSIIIAEDLDVSDLNILATFFAVLADELALIATVKSCPIPDDTFPVPDAALTLSKKNTHRKKIKKIKRKKIVKK